MLNLMLLNCLNSTIVVRTGWSLAAFTFAVVFRFHEGIHSPLVKPPSPYSCRSQNQKCRETRNPFSFSSSPAGLLLLLTLVVGNKEALARAVETDACPSLLALPPLRHHPSMLSRCLTCRYFINYFWERITGSSASRPRSRRDGGSEGRSEYPASTALPQRAWFDCRRFFAVRAPR